MLGDVAAFTVFDLKESQRADSVSEFVYREEPQRLGLSYTDLISFKTQSGRPYVSMEAFSRFNMDPGTIVNRTGFC